MRINNKGFTLVELLVAISILAILTILAIPTLRAFQANNTDTKFENYKKSLQSSGKLYNDSYSDDVFGEASYGCQLVKVNELINKKIAKDIALKDISCNIDNQNSFVVIRKFNREYSYKSYLYCEDSQGVEQYSNLNESYGLCSNEHNGPEILTDVVSNTSKDSKKKSVKVILKDEYGFKANQSFEYVWTTATNISSVNFSGAKTYNFNNQPIKSTGDVVKLTSRSIDMPEMGEVEKEYRLAIRPKFIQNIVGISNTKPLLVGPFFYDKKAPDCPSIKVTDQNGKIVNANHSAKIINFNYTFSGSDYKNYDVIVYKDGKEFIKDSEKTNVNYGPSADGTYEVLLTVRDYAGNKRKCPKTGKYIVDNVAPVCPTITAKTNGSNLKVNTWTRYDVNFTFGFSNDTVSWDWYTDSSTVDYTYKGINYKKWANYPKSTTTATISGQGQRKVLIRVYDEATNYSDCPSSSYYIEKCQSTKISYGNWGNCSKTCGGGTQTRTVTNYSTLKDHTSYSCSSYDESQSCNTQVCPAISMEKPTISNSHHNKWTNSKYTFTMKTKSKAADVGSWWWKWKGGDWTQYADSAGKNSLTSQKMKTEHDADKLYVRVCSKNASGVGDNANCTTSDATIIKTDFTAPSKVDKGKETKGDWYYWWFRYKDELSGLTAVNKSSGSNLYYCYNACSRDCIKKKHDENTWEGPNNVWYRQAEIQNNLERGNDKVDKLTMKTSKDCGKYKVHVYLKACDVAGNCTGLHKYSFDFT